MGDAVIQEDDNDSIYIIVKLNKNEDNEYVRRRIAVGDNSKLNSRLIPS